MARARERHWPRQVLSRVSRAERSAAARARARRRELTGAPSFEQIPIYMAAVNLLMAHRAVLKQRQGQVMKRRRHDSHDFHRRGWEIRVALQADESDIGALQHSCIG